MNNKQVSTNNSLEAAKQAFGVLKRHVWGVVVSAVGLAAIGVAVVVLLPNTYRASTTILVDPQRIPDRYVATTVTSDPSERLNTLTQQVLSATRLQEIVDQLNLYPELRRKKTAEETLDYIRSKISIELKQGGGEGLSSFTITYQDSDRWIVAPVANQLAASFYRWNLKIREEQALGTTQFLASELEEAKRSLEEQEHQLEAFRMTHAGETPDTLTSNLQVLSRLQSQLQSTMDAISRLDEERILLTQIKNPEALREPAALPERSRLLQEKTRLENELWTLERQYTDTYPDVITVTEQLKEVEKHLAALPPPVAGSTESLDSNTRVRLGLIDTEMQRLKKQEAAIQQQISSYQANVDAVPVLETRLAELTRNYDASRQNYQSLLDKTFSAGMAEDLERKQQAERFRILDPATTPQKPFRPKRLPLMAAAIVVGFLLSGGAVIGLDFLRGCIKTESELKALLPAGVRILGTIPPITSRADVKRGRLVAIQSLAFVAATLAVLVLFLIKTKPIL